MRDMLHDVNFAATGSISPQRGQFRRNGVNFAATGPHAAMRVKLQFVVANLAVFKVSLARVRQSFAIEFVIPGTLPTQTGKVIVCIVEQGHDNRSPLPK
jgi:hypothetical protein